MFDPEPLRQRETAADACARVLRGAILRGDLAVGDKLPPERQLAKSLGVNRLTLRNALAQLAAAGLVSVKQGSGYRVRDFRRVGGLDLLPGLMQLSVERGDVALLAAELLFLRRHLAAAVLERVGLEADAAKLAHVREAVDAFAAVVDADADEQAIADADLNVLAALLDATGSPVMALCLNPVVSVLATFDQLRRAIYAEPRSNVAGYRLLLGWLDNPKPELIATITDELERRDERTLQRIRQRSA